MVGEAHDRSLVAAAAAAAGMLPRGACLQTVVTTATATTAATLTTASMETGQPCECCPKR